MASLLFFLAGVETVDFNSQSDNMGVLHGGDAVHRPLLWLVYARRALAEHGRLRHHRHHQEEDRLAVLQQCRPRTAWCHHQTTGSESICLCPFLVCLNQHYKISVTNSLKMLRDGIRDALKWFLGQKWKFWMYLAENWNWLKKKQKNN